MTSQKHVPHLHAHSATAPLPLLNPTRVLYKTQSAESKSHSPSSDPVSDPNGVVKSSEKRTAHVASHPAVTYKWTSRNNRKGRHAISIDPKRLPEGTESLPAQSTTSWKRIAKGIWRMCTSYPVWDVSYDVATIFTFGSVIWVINAFFVWLPLVRPDTEFAGEELDGGGITAFIGATIFVAGSILLMAEAVNENRTACFGWAVTHAMSHGSSDESGETLQLRPVASQCTHHHRNKANLVGKGKVTSKITTIMRPGSSLQPNSKSWIWFPSLSDLRTHYLHELGFLASLTQLLAASIFWVAGLTALPGIYNHMSRTVTVVLYWTPQVVGGSGFIISGALFMLETQTHWYRPALGTLGWWIGAWNLIGGLGFTLCPAFGYDRGSWAQYQAALSTFWGSWAFLIGSVLQWYESLEKYPVEVRKS